MVCAYMLRKSMHNLNCTPKYVYRLKPMSDSDSDQASPDWCTRLSGLPVPSHNSHSSELITSSVAPVMYIDKTKGPELCLVLQAQVRLWKLRGAVKSGSICFPRRFCNSFWNNLGFMILHEINTSVCYVLAEHWNSICVLYFLVS